MPTTTTVMTISHQRMVKPAIKFISSMPTMVMAPSAAVPWDSVMR